MHPALDRQSSSHLSALQTPDPGRQTPVDSAVSALHEKPNNTSVPSPSSRSQ
ncbi:hypothetical protein PGT21_021281 [Puccinia graminis f. sp. tritici]|uniref:Uncharacterized protein n=1 Tax=Puccinia graminis f. sp. tritici TaxID=56615 RepID=A0A5B0MV08_PUCGR|nr:hypothetical protein PGT21_021281 [Puccinia graminis f. sp. tritici]KAA1134678.1 hypothetical protein PGTUg99_012903 [Puccinia graminis f. sp. tritici]